MQRFQYKIMYRMIRNKTFESGKEYGKYNIVIDGTRFKKAHYEASPEWLSQTKDGKTTWYIGTLDMKLVANNMCVPIMNEFMKNEDIEEENINGTEERKKQDCELKAAKRLIEKFKKNYPRLPIRIIADSLYPCASMIKLCEENKIEYIFVLKDKKLPSITKEFLTLVSDKNSNRKLVEEKSKITYTMWENQIDYNCNMVNVIR